MRDFLYYLVLKVFRGVDLHIKFAFYEEQNDMMLKNINNAYVVIAKVRGICEFVINKQNHTIVQTKNMVGEMAQDVTDECINLGCKYLIDSQGNMSVDYKIGNILTKILDNAVDMDCIKFFADYDFEIAYV